MAENLIVLRTDQTAASQSRGLQAVAEAARNLYYALQKQKLLMRPAFDDTDPQNIIWTQLETLWGCPTEREDPEDPESPLVTNGETLWSLVNGTLILLDSSSGNNDFQKLMRRVV